ncbi:5-bromo-4-chloroindolyl phosphate hydrolysis family protein [Loktanella sp. R86503]|uniref:5-bromo-4-chloroindolyl phosphate hydrolysis family protein n=1 Tax=Loktanella sp. R86503 TaxID=3093847 RepID=UPI0036DA0789
MAKPYGGKFSPGAKPAGQVQQRPTVDPVGARANLMLVPPVILLFTSLGSDPAGLATGIAGAASLGLGAWLLRGGLRATAAWQARSVARRPALPRKILAALLTGLGVALATATGSDGLLGSAVYGIVATAAHLAAFGIDPLQNKRLAGVDSFQQDRVARVVEEAEAHLSAMMAQITALNDRPLQTRVAAFQSTARTMIRTVEEDPRDLTSARKFLGVYLQGATDATSKYADLTRRKPTTEAREAYVALLDDLDRNFNARTARLLDDDRSDMDIEIKVLRDRLAREGIADRQD